MVGSRGGRHAGTLTALAWFVTRSEVVIGPAVPDWPLSAAGHRRVGLMPGRPWAQELAAVFGSAERKARETAAPLAARLGLELRVRAAPGENDRSATGYLPGVEFEAAADLFLAYPDRSTRGWERAADAQARIVAAVEAALAEAPPGDVAIVAHGGAGALLRCRLAGRSPARRTSHPAGAATASLSTGGPPPALSLGADRGVSTAQSGQDRTGA